MTYEYPRLNVNAKNLAEVNTALNETNRYLYRLVEQLNADNMALNRELNKLKGDNDGK